MSERAEGGSEDELRHAIDVGEFEVHYQPIVSIESRRKVAAEALVRWRHPTRGLISPDKFIPLAEETGLINQLGEMVLLQACKDAVRWPSHSKIAVNLSAVQFQNADLANQVERILSVSGMSSKRLEMEITESVLLQCSVKNIGTLHELRGLGVSIALDDFGTGYSSLSYLRSFPFDKIKIDRSFVSEMPQMDVCAAIVCAVANLGRSLDIVTTAEGVETEQQFELLRAAGCTQAQGYLFGRPCPIAEFDFDDAVTPPAAKAKEDAALTAQDIMLVRSSFALLVAIQDKVACLFYERLFALAPDLRRLFSDDMSEQRHKLMTVLSSCVGKLHDLASIAPAVRDLGARHVAYGTRDDHYSAVGEALLWALSKGLGESFTPDVRSAWTKVYGVLATTMQAGAAQVVQRRAAG